MSGNRAENVHIKSELLSDRENQDVFDIIGKRCFVSSNWVWPM